MALFFHWKPDQSLVEADLHFKVFSVSLILFLFYYLPLHLNELTVITELPAGKAVEFLLGITNNADRDFVLDSAEASFR